MEALKPPRRKAKRYECVVYSRGLFYIGTIELFIVSLTVIRHWLKVRDCFTKATSKVKDTPCLKLQGAYMDCLSSYSSLYCKDLASNLEECSAKHIGKLD